MSREKFTAAEVAQALRDSKGMVYVAARQLDCAANTIYNYAARYKIVQEAMQQERGILVDVAELALWKAIQNGEAWAISLALKTIGNDRGYTERLEIDMRYVPMVKQIEQLAAQRGTSAGDLFNDLISVLSEESGTAPTGAN